MWICILFLYCCFFILVFNWIIQIVQINLTLHIISYHITFRPFAFSFDGFRSWILCLSWCMESRAFSKSMKVTSDVAYHSTICSIMFPRMNIWNSVLPPLLILTCFIFQRVANSISYFPYYHSSKQVIVKRLYSNFCPVSTLWRVTFLC